MNPALSVMEIGLFFKCVCHVSVCSGGPGQPPGEAVRGQPVRPHPHPGAHPPRQPQTPVSGGGRQGQLNTHIECIC